MVVARQNRSGAQRRCQNEAIVVPNAFKFKSAEVIFLICSNESMVFGSMYVNGSIVDCEIDAGFAHVYGHPLVLRYSQNIAFKHTI